MMSRKNRKLAIMSLIILFIIGGISGKFNLGFGGIATVSAATNVSSQDGIGYSGSILGDEVLGRTFTGYQAWPSGFIKGSSAFVGGIYDGTSIWMIPYNADRLMKFNPSTGEMTGYSNWPAGFTKGSNAFAGGVYDGTNIWLIPYSANQVIKVNATTGEMTGYSSWPDGSKGSDQFMGGAFDGTSIWLAPYSGSRLIKVDTTTGAMSSYNSWPSGTVLGSYPFNGSIFDGTSIWLIPKGADHLIKVDPATGNMTVFNNWPSGYTRSADAFSGGVFDGTNIWLIPDTATHVIKIDTTTGDMTGYNGWPSGFTKGSGSFAGGVYDGMNIWLVPASANRLIKVNAATGVMTGFDNWPSGFTKGSSAFLGGVYDGRNVWMIPFMADRLMKFGDSSNADISSLMLSSGSLSPAFASGTTSYTASVTNSVYGITVTPTAAHAGASVKVNGTAVTSGAATGGISLNEGSNMITVEVIAEDGTTTRTYTVNVTRESAPLSTNTDLSSLMLSSGSLSPAFASGTTSYTASVTNSVYGITVTPTAAHAGASVKVNGKVVMSGLASEMINLNEGSNTITVETTAADGVTTKTYTVIITREAAISGGGDPSHPDNGGSGSTPTGNSSNGSSYIGNVSSKVISTNGSISVPVGSAGELSLPGEVTLIIPAGASDRELRITIEKLTDTQDLLSDQQILISPVYEILKNITQNFTKPVTLSFVFDASSLKENQQPVVFYYDEVKKEWVQIDGSKIEGNKISVEVNHFTKFAVMAVNKEEQSESTQPIFSDISGHWAASDIHKAARSSIVDGYANGTFMPNSFVTRSEFVVMLMKALKSQEEAARLTFTDAAEVGAWAQQAVRQAAQLGIITGYSDGSFRPNTEITRTEMAVIFFKVLALKVEDDQPVTSFVDDAQIPKWAKSQVAALKNLGLITGKGNHEFAPNDKATRAEAVTILLKMMVQNRK